MKCDVWHKFNFHPHPTRKKTHNSKPYCERKDLITIRRVIYFWFSSQDLWLLWMLARRKIADGGGVAKSSHESEHEAFPSGKVANLCKKRWNRSELQISTGARKQLESAPTHRHRSCQQKSRPKKVDIQSHQLKAFQGRSYICHLSDDDWHHFDTVHRSQSARRSTKFNLALRTTGCFNSRNVHLCFTGAV